VTAFLERAQYVGISALRSDALPLAIPSAPQDSHPAALMAQLAQALAPLSVADVRKMPVQGLDSIARKIWDNQTALKPFEQPAESAAPDRQGGLSQGLHPAWEQGVFLPQTNAQPFPKDPLAVTVHRLSNGMTVYLSPNKQERRVYYEIAVRAGSRHDPLAATGMAHYLEHMQFKGTRHLGTVDFAAEKPHLDRITELYDKLFKTTDPKQREKLYSEINKASKAAAKYAVPNEIDKLYAEAGFTDINAHTDYEETVYEGNFPSNRAELWARTESERIENPIYRIFQPELEAVYEEYNTGQDDPDNGLWNAADAALFSGHPYGRDIIGLGEHLKNPSISRMQEFFRERYRPNNMAIFLSGDFDRDEMLPLIEKQFGRLKPAAIPPGPAGQVRPLRGVEKTELLYPAEEIVALGWQVPGHGHPDEDALLLMNVIMHNEQTGILDLSATKAQKVKEADASLDIRNEAGAWLAVASPKEGQTVEEAQAVLLEAVAKLKAGEFTEQDVQSILTNFEVGEKLRLENNQWRVSLMRRSYIQGQQWELASQRLERLRRVGKADIVRVANKYLGADHAVIYRRKGGHEADKVAKPKLTAVPIDPAKHSAAFRELSALPVKALTPRWLRRGAEYRSLSRAWGRLYWAPNKISDVFQLEFHFNMGTADDGRLPLAFDLLQLSGAGSLDADEFEKALYRLGAAMEIKLTDDKKYFIRLRGLDANFGETIKLVLRRFSEPNAAPGAFKQLLSIERGDRQDRKLDADQIFDALGEFAKHGKDSPILHEISARQLGELKETELKALLKSLAGMRRDVIYSGSRPAREVADLLSASQPGLEFKPPPPQTPDRLILPKKPRVVFAHQSGMAQALIGAYAADGVMDARELADESVFNNLMGHGMGGVYFQEMRESRALAYTAQGGYATGKRLGDDSSIAAFVGTQADKAKETMRLLRRLMLRPPLDAGRVSAAIRQAQEELLTESITFRDAPERVMEWRRRGLPGDMRKGMLKELRSYTPARLEAFVARFKKKPLTFFILADRDRIDIEALKKFGDFEERSVDELSPF